MPLPETPSQILSEETEEDTFILEGLVNRLSFRGMVGRLSRQEIYADISDMSRISRVYIVMIVLYSGSGHWCFE